jgi:hypothetical protein
MTYSIRADQGSEMIIRDEPNVRLVIPVDEANTDYKQFLAWVAEGNEPEVAEL